MSQSFGQFASAAIGYAEQGIAVFRLLPRAKEPKDKGGFQTAATDQAKLIDLWNKGRASFNVGIATGAISGFWVLDLDGEQAEAALAALEAQHGALPATVEQATGKGRHLCFAWDPARPVRNLSKRSRERIGPEIDVRGDGGYIVAPPSVHPSGRVYAWSPGRSPAEIAFAPAPGWLMDLVVPPVSERAAAPKPAPRVKVEGSATPYGEAALANACRTISTAPVGRQESTIWETACSIGRLCAGGEIQTRYAFAQLVDAALSLAPSGKWSNPRRWVETKVERAFTWAVDYPKTAPEQRGAQPSRKAEPRALPSESSSAGALAIGVREARALWASSRSAWVKQVTDWLNARGLEPNPGTLGDPLSRLRAHPDVAGGPALLAPMYRPGETELTALAVLPLNGRPERFASFVGDRVGRASPLNPLDGPGALLVALDLQDAWALAQASSAPIRAVVIPTLSGFAGGALGDRFGRVDVSLPRADPARPPWRLDDQADVYLAVPRALHAPDVRQRQSAGGTMVTALSGDRAAKFYGALAEQHWLAAGANTVRVLHPTGRGRGFNTGGGR